MKHDYLVKRAENWLLYNKRCSFVLTEQHGGPPETPDAIGWKGYSSSFMIECKTSRSDFRSDAKKYQRVHPEEGMGMYRYYLAPRGVLILDDVRDSKWGLLEIHGRTTKIIKEAEQTIANKDAEISFLIASLRRVQLRIGSRKLGDWLKYENIGQQFYQAGIVNAPNK